MSKKKIEQIKDDFQQLMDEALLYSKKKQKNAFPAHQFKGNQDKQNSFFAKDKIQQLERKTIKKGNKKSQEKEIFSQFTEKKQVKSINKPQQKHDFSHKKKRKSHWQNNESQSKNYVTVLDRRLDLKQLSNKSILCLGGIESGKNELALALANTCKGKKAYISIRQNIHEEGLKIRSKFDKEQKEDSNSEQMLNMYRIHTLLDKDQRISIDSLKGEEFSSTNNKIEPDNILQNIIQEDFEFENQFFLREKLPKENWIVLEETSKPQKAILAAKEQGCSVTT